MQLSRLFEVSADYLLNDDLENDAEIFAAENPKADSDKKRKTIVGICIASAGLLGNFVIYILSRCIEVMIPYIHYDENGTKWYTWGELTGYSYRYFIQDRNLEFLAGLFWILSAVGLVMVFFAIKDNIWKKENALDQSE